MTTASNWDEPDFLKQRLTRRKALKASAMTAGTLVVAGCTGDDDAPNASVAPAEAATTTSEPTPETSTTVGEAEPQNNGNAGDRPVATGAPVDAHTAVENWQEPWTWRPGEFRGEHLQLNVIEHETPSVIVGFGNPGHSLFGYNGTTPGPTVRMRGDETFLLKVFNHLGLNGGQAPIGPAPDPASGATPPDLRGGSVTGVQYKPDFCLGEHSNGVHSVRTTNMHTHGLHVRPGENPPDTPGSAPTLSDDIFARLIPREDVQARLAAGSDCDIPNDSDGIPLRPDERVGGGTYEFRLGDVQGIPGQPHPPGTHWYHPHAHGSTHNQVSSGLAGFLVIEGDVDAEINMRLAGTASPDPAIPTGPNDYRERMMFIQRINPGNVTHDPDAISRQLQAPPAPVVNGLPQAANIVMRPGATERWRLLNGSVDGQGYLRFMVLKGQWVHEVAPNPPSSPVTVEELIAQQAQLLRVDDDGVRHVPTTEEIEGAKAHLYQLSADGVTLIREQAGEAQYYLKDLDFPADPNPLEQDFTNLADCYRDARSLAACYARPNELYMSPAQRADFIFQAPPLAANDAPEVYTVIGKATAIHTGNLQRRIELAAANLEYAHARADEQGVPVEDIITALKISIGLPANTIVAYVTVREQTGDSAPPAISPYDLQTLSDQLTVNVAVPAYLRPIGDTELLLTAPERATRNIEGSDDLYRTRRTVYSGWGAATWPDLRTEQLTKFDADGAEPGPINPVYLAASSIPEIGEVVRPPLFRTMAIDGRKFNPDDPLRPMMGLDTAEEWASYNNSISLFGTYATTVDDQIDFSATADERVRNERIATRSYLIDHAVGYPVTRSEADQRGWNVTTRGIDHPFHIHTNPMWVLRVDVPDENGELVNVLPEPQWHDVMWMPRNAGRIVFRSRFPDFTGTLVNHCHILLHEDNGMMQEVEIVDEANPDPDRDPEPGPIANYVPSPEVAGVDGPVDDVYPPDSLADAYRQCTRFVDNNRTPGRAQEFPATNGVFDPPTL